jgi:hypothetical protein
LDVTSDAVVAGASGDSAKTSWIRVGRWMGEDQLANMKATGMLQERMSSKASDVAMPAGINAFASRATQGSLNIESDVPASTAMTPEGSGWSRIEGPNSLGGRNAARLCRPIPELPPVSDIQIKVGK